VRPTAPVPQAPLVGRETELGEVRKRLKPGGRLAVTAVHGLAGVGKTLLVEHLAQRLEPEFAGGVLFESLGAKFRSSDLAGSILRRWAVGALGLTEAEGAAAFTPGEVRDLLARHGPVLAVLDDVWDLEAALPLLDALPGDASVLVTTRKEGLAADLRGEVYPLDVLSCDDAVALLRARVPMATDVDEPLLKDLAKGLGRHAMALDIAGRSLARRKDRRRWPALVDEMTRQVREGSGFGEVRLPEDEERVSAVEAALSLSYGELSEAGRERYRSLGAFAPDAPFADEAAAGVWDCSFDEAADWLATLAERGLLTRPAEEGDGLWRQHGLLRAYALALLERAGEVEHARERHAAVYLARMVDASDRQEHHRLYLEYLQLRHAFEWLIERDVARASRLAVAAAELQAGFGLVRDGYDWASRLVTETREAGGEAQASAQVALGIALVRLAGLPGEDRPARLRQALAASDAALAHYRPEVAPLDHAMTQNNRGNALAELAGLPGEDRPARLLAATVSAYAAAVTFLDLGYEQRAQIPANLLLLIRDEAGPLFEELWAELGVGDPPDWLRGG
jgi:hypothetical protein